MEQIIEKINFGEFDSQKRKMHLLERSAPTPARKEKRESLAYMQGDYDFSGLDGQEYHESRELSYTFYVLERDYDYRKHNQTVIENELMRYGEIPLYDSYSVGYYYHAKCMGVRVTDDHLSNRLIIEITFKGYPFKTSILPEGHDIWDLFNFDLDVSQSTSFEFTSYWSNFKQLNVGDMATYGAWATQYYDPNSSTGGGASISPRFHGITYRIVDKIAVKISDLRPSRYAYKLANHDGWLLEQDILQAQTEFLDIILENSGIADVPPKITTNHSVTIVRGNEIYNLMPGTYETEQFVLKSGENSLQLYIPDVTLKIDFTWYKELI